MRGVITALREELAKADCSRRRVAAVVFNGGTIVGRGHNRLQSGSCLDGHCPRGLLSYDQQPKDVGYAESGCTSVHAEVAALADAGSAAVGATLIVTEEPCPDCQIELLVCGVTDVQVVNFNHPVFSQKFAPPV